MGFFFIASPSPRPGAGISWATVIKITNFGFYFDINFYVYLQYGNTWSPFPADIIDLYTKVASKSLNFDWKPAGGRRNPDEEDKASPTPLQNVTTAPKE